MQKKASDLGFIYTAPNRDLSSQYILHSREHHDLMILDREIPVITFNGKRPRAQPASGSVCLLQPVGGEDKVKG